MSRTSYDALINSFLNSKRSKFPFSKTSSRVLSGDQTLFHTIPTQNCAFVRVHDLHDGQSTQEEENHLATFERRLVMPMPPVVALFGWRLGMGHLGNFREQLFVSAFATQNCWLILASWTMPNAICIHWLVDSSGSCLTRHPVEFLPYCLMERDESTSLKHKPSKIIHPIHIYSLRNCRTIPRYISLSYPIMLYLYVYIYIYVHNYSVYIYTYITYIVYIHILHIYNMYI